MTHEHDMTPTAGGAQTCPCGHSTREPKTKEGIMPETTEKPFTLDGFVADHLRDGLIYEDLMVLPPWDAEYALNSDREDAYQPFYSAMNGFHFNAVLAHVLIRVKEANPDLAASIGAEVESYIDAGDAYPEWIWDWATEAGLDPEKIRAEAREKRAAWLAEPTRQAKRSAAELQNIDAAPAAGTSN
jgi:hypothetical protein